MALLTICIPIYNRIEYLNRTLNAFMNSERIILNDVCIYVSDNCSTDDIGGLCRKFIDCGLPIVYHRNSENLGMDGNFANCLKSSTGKYTLLLGSDDVPKLDYISSLLAVLKRKEVGVLHLYECKADEDKCVYYDSVDKFLLDVNIDITYISTNIVNTKFIKGIDYDRYKGTFFTQIPAYLKALNSPLPNAILFGNFYEEDNDSKNNGGYNYFEVFVTNLLNIFKEQVDIGNISYKTYKIFKKRIFKNHIAYYIVMLLIFKKRGRFNVNNGWLIIMNNYAMHIYSYYYVLKKIVSSILKKTRYNEKKSY